MRFEHALPKLGELNLSSNKIGDAGMRALESAIAGGAYVGNAGGAIVVGAWGGAGTGCFDGLVVGRGIGSRDGRLVVAVAR